MIQDRRQAETIGGVAVDSTVNVYGTVRYYTRNYLPRVNPDDGQRFSSPAISPCNGEKAEFGRKKSSLAIDTTDLWCQN
jgi:hypothetical protein